MGNAVWRLVIWHGGHRRWCRWVEDINGDVEWLVLVYTIMPDYGRLRMVS